MNNNYDAAKTTLVELGYNYTAGDLKWKLKVGKGSYVEPVVKTVVDAVNEYEGVAPVPCYTENKEQIIMALINFDGYLAGDLTTGDGVRNNEFWKVICTREEFNKCVEEMADNGMSITYSKYKDNYINNTGGMTNMNTKPVYTQAMADDGVMPSVGMEVMHLSVKKVVMLLADSNSKYVLKSVNDFYSLALRHDIKPLDTRTDTEKAIDNILALVAATPFKCKEQSKVILNEIKAGKVHGVTWSGK